MLWLTLGGIVGSECLCFDKLLGWVGSPELGDVAFETMLVDLGAVSVRRCSNLTAPSDSRPRVTRGLICVVIPAVSWRTGKEKVEVWQSRLGLKEMVSKHASEASVGASKPQGNQTQQQTYLHVFGWISHGHAAERQSDD